MTRGIDRRLRDLEVQAGKTSERAALDGFVLLIRSREGPLAPADLEKVRAAARAPTPLGAFVAEVLPEIEAEHAGVTP